MWDMQWRSYLLKANLPLFTLRQPLSFLCYWNSLIFNSDCKLPISAICLSLIFVNDLGQNLKKKNCLESFYLCCLWCILGISCRDKVTNTDEASRFLEYASPCLHSLQWMNDGHLPKNIMFVELAMGHHPAGCPVLHFKDICKGAWNTGIKLGS